MHMNKYTVVLLWLLSKAQQWLITLELNNCICSFMSLSQNTRRQMVGWPVNNELWKEAAMTNLKQLLEHFYGGTEKNHDQPQWLVRIRDTYFHVWSTV